MHDIRGDEIDTEGGVSTFYMGIYYDQYDWSNSKYCYMEAVLNEDNKPVNGFDVKEDPYGYDGPMEDSTCNKVGQNIPYNQEDNSILIDGIKYILYSEEEFMDSYDYNY